MAYANLVSQACTNNAEVFKRVRDFLCKRNGSYDYSTTGIGWTLHDAVYAADQDNVAFGDYFVAYSPGEDGDQDLYVKVTYTSGYVNIHIYLYWNNSTHAGVTAASTANNWTNTNSTASTLWVYGDLDSVVFIAKYGTTYYTVISGHCPDSLFATGVATSAASVSSGSGVVVAVDAVPSGWVSGRKIYIRDNANIEIVTISSIDGTNVTISSISASYLAGCKLQGEVSYISTGTAAFLSTHHAVIGHTGAKSMSHVLDAASAVSTTTNDSLAGGSPLTRPFIAATGSLIGPLKNVYMVTTTGRSPEATETVNNLGTFRHFVAYNGKGILVKEV